MFDTATSAAPRHSHVDVDQGMHTASADNLVQWSGARRQIKLVCIEVGAPWMMTKCNGEQEVMALTNKFDMCIEQARKLLPNLSCQWPKDQYEQELGKTGYNSKGDWTVLRIEEEEKWTRPPCRFAYTFVESHQHWILCPKMVCGKSACATICLLKNAPAQYCGGGCCGSLWPKNHRLCPTVIFPIHQSEWRCQVKAMQRDRCALAADRSGIVTSWSLGGQPKWQTTKPEATPCPRHSIPASSIFVPLSTNLLISTQTGQSTGPSVRRCLSVSMWPRAPWI